MRDRTDAVQPSFDALSEAAGWFARLRDSPSASDQQAWQRWLSSSADHRQAWQAVEQISSRFVPLRDVIGAGAAAQALQRRGPASARRRLALKSIAGLGGAGVLGWAVYQQTPATDWARGWVADYRTATGQIQQWPLDDGSQLWLNTASAANVDYSASLRRLDLLGGEIFVDSVVDAARPLVVDTRFGRLRALERPHGQRTRFSVRVLPGRTGVAVFAGSVDLTPTRARAARVIDAGMQSALSATAVDSPSRLPAGREAWTRGVLLAEDITLGELIGELSRYRSGHIALAPDVARLRVLGGYPLHDPDKVLDMLARALPIKVRRPLPWWTSIERA